MDEVTLMDTAVEILGLTAGAVTSMGFIPQLIRGYRTKKLDDVSLLCDFQSDTEM